MMKVLSFRENGTEILFDDFNNEPEYSSVWVCMCDSCMKKYDSVIGDRLSEGSGWCSVLGCVNEADWYVDFNAEDVELKEVKA